MTRVFVTAFILVLSLGVLPPVAGAEWFADLYFGASFTQKEDIELSTPGFSASAPSNPHGAAFLIGARIGHWFDGLKWLGVALDISHFEAGGGYDIVPLSALLMARLPLLVGTDFPNGRLQPYVGVGPGVFIGSLEAGGGLGEETSSDLGIDARAGATWLFTKTIGIFGEYRFTHFKGDYDFGAFRLETTVPTHHVGIGVRFQF